MRTRAVWKKLPAGNPRAARKSRERDLNFYRQGGCMSQYLTDGAILDKRYEIQEELGEGGTSITYLAIDLRISKRVAVKEFFDRSYMKREDSGSIKTINGSDAGRQERERSAFLKEAKIVADQGGIPGLINVTDYFEANGTAYIVMDVIPADLKKYLDANGNIAADTILQGLLPLTETLAMLHKKGIIHRDISPENIGIKREEGIQGSVLNVPFEKLNFILMDFGSAGDQGSGAEDARVKPGYAAPEQYKADGKQGPWTDVYGLCAAMYRCITGMTPQNALMRQMYDELKRPSELGIRIRKDAEAVILKGLAVSPEDRYQSMDELGNDIRSLFSNEAEEKRKRNRKRKKRTAAVIAAAALAGGAVFGYSFYQKNREELYFRNQKREEFYLYPGEGTDSSAFFQDADKIKKRVEVLTDGKYIWEEKRDVIRVVVPQECLGSGSEAKEIAYYITDPWKMYLWYLDCSDMINIVSLQKRFEQAVVLQEAGSSTSQNDDAHSKLRLTIPDAKEEPWESFYKNSNGTAVLLKDHDDILESNNGQYPDTFRGAAKEDGTIETGCEVSKTNLLSTMIHNLTTEPLNIEVDAACDSAVQFEAVSGDQNPGSFQTDEETVAQNSILMLLGGSSGLDRAGSESISGELVDEIEDMKRRLDILGKPYAIGVTENGLNNIAVKMHANDITDFETELLEGGLELYWREGNTGIPDGRVSVTSEGQVLFEPSDPENNFLYSYLLELAAGEPVYLEGNSGCIASGIKTAEGITFTEFYCEAWKNNSRLDERDLALLKLYADRTTKGGWIPLRSIVFYGQDGKMIPDQREARLSNAVYVEEIEALSGAAEKYGAQTTRGRDSITISFNDIPETGFNDYVSEVLKNLLKAVPRNGMLRKVFFNFISENGNRIDVRLYMSGSKTQEAGCRVDGVSDADTEQIRKMVTDSGIFSDKAIQEESFWYTEVY